MYSNKDRGVSIQEPEPGGSDKLLEVSALETASPTPKKVQRARKKERGRDEEDEERKGDAFQPPRLTRQYSSTNRLQRSMSGLLTSGSSSVVTSFPPLFCGRVAEALNPLSGVHAFSCPF